jgi:hypothetical protein
MMGVVSGATRVSGSTTVSGNGIPGMIFEHNVGVTMIDGAVLRTNVYRPDNPGRFPVVMLHGPYGKDTHCSDAPIYQVSWNRLVAK